MKIKLIAAFAIGIAPTVKGAAGIYDSFIFTTSSGATPLTFYDIGAATANPDFEGLDLGSFNTGDSLQLGGQQKSFKNNGTDVTSHSILWRVYPSSSPSGTFNTVSMPFQWNFGDTGAPSGLNNAGDQQWGGNSEGANSDPIEISSNVLQGLTPGEYSLEIFTRITTNGTDAASEIFRNNGGSNYTASFTVIPEPSAALLGGIGALLLLRRRK